MLRQGLLTDQFQNTQSSIHSPVGSQAALGPPRIGIDGLNLAIPRGTGVATYARTLSQCVAQLGHPIDILYGLDISAETPPALQEVEFYDQLQTPRSRKRPKYPSLPWVRSMLGARRGETAFEISLTGRVKPEPLMDRMPCYDRVLNVAGLFDRAAHYYRVFGRFMTVHIPDPPAIMHWTYPVPLRLDGAHNVYVVHDLVPLRMPYATLDHKPTHFRLLADCLRHADHICTVSERSREDLLAFYPDASADRVTNSYQAVVAPPVLLPQPEMERLLRDGFGLEPGKYFLFFGSIEPKKNVRRLLEAHLSLDYGTTLVVVSARTWQADGEQDLLDHASASGRLRHIEYVSQTMLTHLIRGARAVTFPSLYEGFGLPVIEAMMLGTPVLTTREGSLAEIAGEAALFVDAYDPRDIAGGLQRLADDDLLCADLREKGLKQAALFGMQPYIDRMRTIYHDVLARPRRTK